MAAIFGVGALFGAFLHQQWLFPFPQFAQIKQIAIQNKAKDSGIVGQTETTSSASGSYTLSIPVQYLPTYQVEKSNGKQLIELRKGKAVFQIPTAETALILVDTWNNADPKEGEEPTEFLKNVQNILQRSRQYGITVIHAPNQPVVDKYPQYHPLKGVVAAAMMDYPHQFVRPPFLKWPPDNNIYTQASELRQKGREQGSVAQLSLEERAISRLLRPLEHEYVLATHEELRYVLWKKGINVLLYVGGALNECMLHRDTGINLLNGSDRDLSKFTIVVLEDCSEAIPALGLDVETTKRVMLDYYMRKIAFVANSKELTFEKP